MDNRVATETLLPWQQGNCAITRFCVSILSSHLAQMFHWTKHITSASVCYGSTATLETKDCAIT